MYMQHAYTYMHICIYSIYMHIHICSATDHSYPQRAAVHVPCTRRAHALHQVPTTDYLRLTSYLLTTYHSRFLTYCPPPGVAVNKSLHWLRNAVHEIVAKRPPQFRNSALPPPSSPILSRAQSLTLTLALTTDPDHCP